MTARPCKPHQPTRTAPNPTPTGLVGADGYEAWVHLAMWCPQTLERLAASEASLALYFWRLDNKMVQMRETVTANLRRRHPDRSLAQLEADAASLVRAEWVTLPREAPKPLWRPEGVMDPETRLWTRWEWPGIEDGKEWAHKLLAASRDRDLTREELVLALGPPPLPAKLTVAMPATKAETGLWEPWERSEFEELALAVTAEVTSEWDRSMVAWDLALLLEALRLTRRERDLATAVASRLLRMPVPPTQPPVVPGPVAAG